MRGLFFGLEKTMSPTTSSPAKPAAATKYLRLDMDARAILEATVMTYRQGAYISELIRRDAFWREQRQKLAEAQCQVCGETK
jgi:hypothetical protein